MEEKAWAWWELVDNLCLLERWEEAVAAHEPYLDWAQTQWEQGALSSTAFLHTVSDDTWSDGWRRVGKVEAWFERFHAIAAQVEPTPVNRLERFYCLRNACRTLLVCGRDDEALAVLSSVHALAQEDPHWERSWEAEVQAHDMEAALYHRRQETDALRRVGMRATSLLESRGVEPLTAEETTRLAVQYDNVAATMFMADQYDLSIPLHRRCIELSPVSEFAYLALPAALWAMTKEREPVLRLLRQGAERCRGDWFAADFQAMPEFEDVRDDADFAAAVGLRQEGEDSTTRCARDTEKCGGNTGEIQGRRGTAQRLRQAFAVGPIGVFHCCSLRSAVHAFVLIRRMPLRNNWISALHSSALNRIVASPLCSCEIVTMIVFSYCRSSMNALPSSSVVEIMPICF